MRQVQQALFVPQQPFPECQIVFLFAADIEARSDPSRQGRMSRSLPTLTMTVDQVMKRWPDSMRVLSGFQDEARRLSDSITAKIDLQLALRQIPSGARGLDFRPWGPLVTQPINGRQECADVWWRLRLA
jgi:hypothetical protein